MTKESGNQYPNFEHTYETLNEFLQIVEIGIIREAIRKSKGNIAGAARSLGLQRTTLQEKIKKYRIKTKECRCWEYT